MFKQLSFRLRFYIGVLLVSLLSCCLFGCSAERQLTRKIDKAKTVAFQNPKAFAEFCSYAFPVKDSVGQPVVERTPAHNVDYSNRIDSLLQASKEAEDRAKTDLSEQGKKNLTIISGLRKEIEGLRSKYKPCKPDTIKKTVTVYQRDTANESVLNQKLDKLSASLEKVSQERDLLKITNEDLVKTKNKRLWYIIGLSALLAGSLFVNLKSFLKGFLF